MADRKTFRALIVDDYLAFGLLLRDALWAVSRRSFDVADSATAALAALRRDRYDVLVTDIHMKPVDGIWLVREVREDPELRKLPIIAVTGFGRDACEREALDAGVNVVLEKPISARALWKKIVEVAATRPYQGAASGQQLAPRGLTIRDGRKTPSSG